MSDFNIDLPEPELTEAQMSSRYTFNGGWRYDPVKKAYQYTYQMREWYRTLDNIEEGNCTITSEEFAVWNVTLWYTKEPGSNYKCVGGYRKSAGFYVLHHKICKQGRELVTTNTWIEWLPMHEQVKQKFTYVYEDGSDPDEVWKNIPD